MADENPTAELDPDFDVNPAEGGVAASDHGLGGSEEAPQSTTRHTGSTGSHTGSGHTTGGSRTGGAARWIPPTPEELQPMFSSYQLMALVGQGGMGAVYQAHQTTLDRIVAIKLLPLELADDEVEFAARFENEARLLAKLNHPGIVRVFEFGQTPAGQMFMVMEYVEGTDVAHLLKPMQPLPPEHATTILLQMCDALGYAHSHDVIHRDIKPSNVMLNAEGHVKVMDFGLAKNVTSQSMALTKSHMVMGTPDYIAPEALLYGVQADHRADIYALGVMFYQMLTGVIPRGKYKAPSERVPALDTRFDLIVRTCMAEQPLERYQDITGLRRSIEKALQSGPQTVQKPMAAAPGPSLTGSVPGSARLPKSQNVSRKVPLPPADSGGGFPLVKVAAVLVLGVASYFIWQEMKQPPQAAAASGGVASSSTAPSAASASSLPATGNGETGSTDGGAVPVDIAPASSPTGPVAMSPVAALPAVAAASTPTMLPTAPAAPTPAPATIVSPGSTAPASGMDDTFAPTLAAPAPGMVPLMLTPAEGDMLDNGGGMPMFDPKDWRFIWTPVTGAADYELEVTKVGFPRPMIKTVVSVPYYRQSSMSYFPGSSPGSAKWRVRARVNGEWQPWSEERSNEIEVKDADILADLRTAMDATPVSSLPAASAALVPQQEQPAEGGVMDNGTTGPSADLRDWLFKWSEVPGATQYRILVHRGDPTAYAVFGNVSSPSHRLAFGSVIMPDQLTGWNWRVAAKVNDTWQPWSDNRTFTVEQAGLDPDPASPPGADPAFVPMLTSPVNGARLENTSTTPSRVSAILRLSWEPVPGATRYHLFILHPDANRSWVNFSTMATSYYSTWTTDIRSGTTPVAKWKIRAEVNGQWQGWSEERVFGFRAPGEPATLMASVPPPSTPVPQGPDPAVSRAWTDRNGRTVTAKFGGLQGDRMIMILPNGNSVPVPLSSLSAESQQVARGMAAARAGGPGTSAAPATPAAPGAVAVTSDNLSITSMKPKSPGTLKSGERVTVSFRYENPGRDPVRIWVRPLTNGNGTPGSRSHGSGTYQKGRGKAEGWFFFDGPTTVDAVEIRMVNSTNNELVARITEPVTLTWK